MLKSIQALPFKYHLNRPQEVLFPQKLESARTLLQITRLAYWKSYLPIIKPNAN